MVVLKRQALGMSNGGVAVSLFWFCLTKAPMTNWAQCRKLFLLPSELLLACTENYEMDIWLEHQGEEAFWVQCRFLPVPACCYLHLGKAVSRLVGTVWVSAVPPVWLLGQKHRCPLSRAWDPAALSRVKPESGVCHFPKTRWGLAKLIKSSF